MIQGLYTSASGMIAVDAWQAAIANNIANATTTGYKAQSPVQLGFYEYFSNTLRRPYVYNREAAPGGGVKVVETYPDLSGGILRSTGNPLNLALHGPGFFVVDTPFGERYTRAGDFSIDADGHLSTQDGFKILSETGQPLDVRGGRVIVAQDGAVTVDAVPSGRVRVVEFESPHRLMREGDNLYRAPDEILPQSAPAVDTRIEQGHLELSNVDISRQMSQMLLGMRAYEANQRVIQAADTTISRLIEQVAMPA
jgi:flagellar basal-body rod protein FlgF